MGLYTLSARFGAQPLRFACAWLALTAAAYADPPPLSGPVKKCDAVMEYFSQVKSTGKMPPYELTNSIRNNGGKSVTDVSWPKPELATKELKDGAVLEESYPISGYLYDKDAPIKFWYQGCQVPAEAYLSKDEKSDKSFSLRSLLRKYSLAASDSATVMAEVVVSIEGDFIQFEITRRPLDAQVGLTGIEPWLNSNSLSAAEANAKEYGYTSTIAPPSKMIKSADIEKLDAKWPYENALFTRRVSGDRNYVRVRLPASPSNAQPTRATLILVSPDGSLIAAGSYATFAPNK
jgi:hypothetical protein